MIAPADIGVYGGLCALATYSRKELVDLVQSNVEFKQYLDLVPDVRELINSFIDSRYSPFLGYLDRLKVRA